MGQNDVYDSSLLGCVGLVVCWDLTTGATVEHKCYNDRVAAMCFMGDRVVTASWAEGSAHVWSLPSCLLDEFILCC